ncbi:aspartate aminotransferase family protein [Flavivirga sp. 57AJ16]|uniref:pyridoxal phosphate-dependent decarboxylase family protein n=1 Tax=Flavivirga sp. 57AJ16 TaxID=3025307 RepID=UPI0023667A5E|nr:aspartate aminotransferase family protein [Flavivirga sp. 57AJ16]MDD7887570.1 aspartate aminotransferase family protein [Flavivirga sp. 57AJ16]
MSKTLSNNRRTVVELYADDYYKDIFYEGAEKEYTRAIQYAQERVSGFLKNNSKPFSGIKPEEIKAKVESIDLDEPVKDYHSLWDEIDDIYVKHATAFHLPEYIAHLNCPVVIPALAAELMISAINSSQDTYDQSAGGTYMERKLIEWTGKQLGYGHNSDGVFTAGGSQSNLMGLLLARDYCAFQLGYDIKKNGCPPDISRFKFFVSETAHYSNHKNATILGLGEQAVVHVKTDGRFRMSAKHLELAIVEELKKGNFPFAVIGTAGTTDFGNIDPLKEISALASKYNLWFHVDAAYGCALLLSANHRSLLNGIELADSVTIDYHKSFFQPISSSAFIVKNKETLNLIKHHADYLNPKDQDYDAVPAQVNKSIVQITRRFDALKLWCTLRYMGKEKLGQYIDDIIATAKEVALLMDVDPTIELLSHSDISALVFRFIPIGFEGDVCALNKHIKSKMFYQGEVLVASTKIKKTFYLKFTILNPLTTIKHIINILSIIKNHGEEYRHSR